MSKILNIVKYKMKYQLLWVALYLCIYLIAISLTYFILIKVNVLNSTTGSLGYRIWGLAIMQFAFSIRFKEDFNLFLTLSNTRLEIFKSLLGVAIGFSLLTSSLIALEKIIFDYVNTILGFHIKDIFHYFAPYNNNMIIQFIFFLLLCLCLSVIGILLGSLFYRYGKKFTLFFWLLLSSLPVIIFPLLAWILYQSNQLSQTISSISKFLNTFNVLLASGYLLLLTLIIGLAAYLNIRRLPQQ